MQPGKEQRKSAPSGVRMRLTRIEPGKTETLRFCDDKLLGWLVHYKNKRSVFCRGEDCPSGTHVINPTWKGYACAQYWNSQLQLWVPTVAEITEHSELDMRDTFARGQIWRFNCNRRTKQRPRPPVTARCLGVSPDRLPLSWPITPTLILVYHEIPPKEMIQSPLPPRQFVTPVTGTAPPDAEGIVESARETKRIFTPELTETFQKIRDKLAASSAMPDDLKYNHEQYGDH